MPTGFKDTFKLWQVIKNLNNLFFGGSDENALVIESVAITDLSLPGTTGTGIEVNEAFGWHDIIGTPQYPVTGAGKPSFSQIASTGVYAWEFALGDEQFYVWHMPHDYLPGSDIHFHVHWFGSQTAEGFARWQFDYIYASGHNTDAYGSATSVYAQEQQSATAYQHMTTETTAVTISGLEVDGVIIARVERIAAVGETDVSGAVFAPIVDIHYQSTNLSTPNKSPNFYAT